MSKRRKVVDGDTVKDVNLYCLCLQPNKDSEMMVQCDFCDCWFHPRCVDLDEDEAEHLSTWNCPGCIDTMTENPSLSKKGLLAFQGRVAPKSGWGQDFLVEDIDEKVLDEKIRTKRHRIEGYNLFREGKVIKISCAKSESGKYLYFKGVVLPSMKDKNYNVHVCLKNGGSTMKWSTCDYPAGIDGECKHIVALGYFIIDLHRQGINKIPDVQTCTDKLQMWHVRKPVSDEPLLFSDITFVKHDPFKVSKKELCSTVKFSCKSSNPFLRCQSRPDYINCRRRLKLIEIKCPFSLFDCKTSIQKQINSSSFYLTRENGEVTLKKNHDYFYQIQGQLNICGIDCCDLVVFVPPDDLMVVSVKRDPQFFCDFMLPKLTNISSPECKNKITDIFSEIDFF